MPKLMKQAGLTLIELMIAIILGSLVVAAVAYIFANASTTARFDDQAAGLQENGRFAMHFISDDLRMANFWGFELQPRNIQNATATICGISPFLWRDGANREGGITLVDAADWTGAGCDTGAADTTPKAGSVMLVIKRVSGTALGEPTETVPGADFPSNKPFLLIGDDPELVIGDGNNLTLGNNEYLWEYMTRVYYVSQDNRLCRKVLASNAAFTSECLIDGVEDMRLVFGIDTDRDGQVEEYSADPESLPSASSSYNPFNFAGNARLCILVQSAGEIQGFNSGKTYSVCGLGPYTTTAPTDGRLRRVFEKSVTLRNTSALAFFN